MKEFKSKVAVITGAASGIGRGLAERCAQEGMKVVLAGINESNLLPVEADLRARGATAISVPADVAKRSDVEALAQRTLDAFGGVHLLANNAGVAAGSTVWDSSWNDWEWVIGVNLWGVIHGIKVFAPIMLAQKDDCHIVNTASVAGLIAYHPCATYQVTKHAIVALSEHLHLSLLPQNARVKVSVLCPGWVRTQIMSCDRNRPAALQNEPAPVSSERQAVYSTMREAVESGMSPEEVADHVFRAIREERFYIVTHDGDIPMIRDRVENLLQGRNPQMPW